MLSQLTLRFHKKLIEALKIRAGHENTSVNALAERFLDDGLKTASAGDGYFQLLADPHATVQQLYRRIILGQTFGVDPVSRDELRFMLVSARQGYMQGRNRLVTQPALMTLLQIMRELLAWQVEHNQVTDTHYLKGIFRLSGDDLMSEYDRFLNELRPIVDHTYAEQLLRPLESGCFELAEFPDAILNEIFTLPRLKAIFPLILRGLDWTDEKAASLAQALRPLIPAVTQTIEAGTLRLDIRVDGQSPGQRPGAWYDTPKMHLMITGQEFVYPCGWVAFSELLGLFTLYAHHPAALHNGHQGDRVMFSPPGSVMDDGFFGIDGLRIFLPEEAFDSLVSQLAAAAGTGPLAEALTGLRCLYGDL